MASRLCCDRAVMRTPYVPSRARRILCVYPRYAKSFGTFQYSYPFFGGRVRAFMPPQGLLTVAAYLPESWPVRFVDENARAATTSDFRWADAVFVSIAISFEPVGQWPSTRTSGLKRWLPCGLTLKARFGAPPCEITLPL